VSYLSLTKPLHIPRRIFAGQCSLNSARFRRETSTIATSLSRLL